MVEPAVFRRGNWTRDDATLNLPAEAYRLSFKKLSAWLEMKLFEANPQEAIDDLYGRRMECGTGSGEAIDYLDRSFIG